MNPTPDHNLEPPPGQPSSQSNMGPNTANDSESSPVDLLPSELRTLHTLQGLRVGKAQKELMEASIKVQIAEQQLEEAKYDKLASQLLILPHRTMPLKIYNDGLTWIAIYECPEGEPLVGRGDSPQLATADFDHQWLGMK